MSDRDVGESAKPDSRDCGRCAGSGLVSLLWRREGTNGRAATFCSCALGRWMRSKQDPDFPRLADLDDIDAGRTEYWPLLEPEGVEAQP